MHKKDIANYCKQIGKPISEEQLDIAATILYIKDTLKLHNTYYNPDKSIAPYVFINYSTMKYYDEIELDDNMKSFKNIKEKELREVYRLLTSYDLISDEDNKSESSSTLNEENERKLRDKFFLEQFRLFYDVYNGKGVIISSDESIMKIFLNKIEDEVKKQIDVTLDDKYIVEWSIEKYKEFMEKNKNEMIKFGFVDKDDLSQSINSTKRYLIYRYTIFKSIWPIHKCTLSLYLKYDIIDETSKVNIINTFSSDEIDGEKMTALEAFKKYFKKSLDDRYNIITKINIDDLDELKKNNYYNHTLKTMQKIIQVHFGETIESEYTFVKLLVGVAKDIINIDRVQEKKGQLEKEYIENKDVCKTSESTIVTVKINDYTCDDTKCDLPDTVNCIDVINYMIMQFSKKEKTHENKE